MDLFAGICVRDYEAAKAWYERFFGREPTFVAHETECVWDLADHRSIFILEDPDRAGCATHTIFVDDLETIVDEIASRGIKPEKRETYKNGVRKATFRDPDGNEIGFGGAPLEGADG
jgi:predicted enzyme related to lactoylglutathione lyase